MAASAVHPVLTYVHTVLDEHPRVANAEIHDDEEAAAAVAVLIRATACFTDRGLTRRDSGESQRRAAPPHRHQTSSADHPLNHSWHSCPQMA